MIASAPAPAGTLPAVSGWQPTRVPHAVAAGRDPEALRTAYLELLKLCLCDLGGTGTTSVCEAHGRLADVARARPATS